MDSDVGITPENNGELIRLNLPQPTEERRRDLVKQCNKIGERTKVEIRNVRSDIKEKLKKAIKDGLSEDNEKDAEDSLQKIHDKFIKQVDTLLEDKQKEIMTKGRGVICTDYHNSIQINGGNYSPPFGGGVRGRGHSLLFLCAA